MADDFDSFMASQPQDVRDAVDRRFRELRAEYATPTPRLVPDRPSDARACRFCGWCGIPDIAPDPYTTDGTVEVCGGCNNAESFV